jgi:hypothetical protein
MNQILMSMSGQEVGPTWEEANLSSQFANLELGTEPKK